jgi:hypothetical protein
MARELSFPLAPCGIAILSAAGAMFGLPPPRRPHEGCAARDQGCQCAVSTPRENSELPANRPLHALAGLQNRDAQ